MLKKILVILFSFLFLSCTQKQKHIFENFLGVHYYNSNNYNLAIEKFFFICNKTYQDESCEYAKYNLALTYLKAGEISIAEKKFIELKSSSISKINSMSAFQLGVLNFKRKNIKKSLDEFKSSINSQPNFIEAKINYEICLKLLKKEDTIKSKLQENQIENESTIMNYIKEMEVELWKSNTNEKKLPYDY